MKVAVLSESPADEAAVRILVEGLLSAQTDLIALPRLQTRGWPAVLRVFPTVLRHLHYQTDAETLVVVVDSDHSPIHHKSHEVAGGWKDKCRLCELRQTVDHVQNDLSVIPNRPPLKTALGVATPTVEAWYQCGVNPRVSEAAWAGGLQSGRFPYSKKDLKKSVYRTDRPSLALETQCATEEAKRLAQDLSTLEQLFPAGFGSLAREVRNW